MPAESSLTVRAELAGLKKDLQAAGNLTEGQAQAMIIGVEKRIKSAENAAKRLTKVQQDATKASSDWNKKLGELQQLANSLPGPLGQIAATAANASKGIAGLGAAGAGVGIAVAAVAALGIGALKGAQAIDTFVGSAADAVKSLDELGMVGALPAETIGSIQRYEASSKAAGVAADILRARVAGLVAGAFEPMIAAVAGILSRLDDLAPTVRLVTDLIGDLQTVSRGVTAVTTLGVSELARYGLGLDDVADAGREAAAELVAAELAVKRLNDSLSAGEKVAAIQADAILELSGASDAMKGLLRETEAIDKATADYVATLDRADPAQRALAEGVERTAEVRKGQIAAELEATEALKRRTEAARRSAEAERRSAEAERKALDDAAASNKERKETEAAEQAIQDALAKRLITQMRVNDAARDDARVLADFNQRAAEATRAMQALGAEVEVTAGEMVGAWGAWADGIVNSPAADITMQAINDIGALSRMHHDQEVAQLQERIDRRKDEISSWVQGEQDRIDSAVEHGQMTEAQAQTERKNVQINERARLAALNKRTRDEEAALLKGFNNSQKVQRAAAAVESLRAGISMIPAFSFLGPLAPAAAAGAAAAALGLAIAGINAQAAPEFPMGRPPVAQSSGRGSPDHQVTGSIRDDEAVLTGRGVKSVGGPAGVEAANRGQAAGATTVNVYLERRLLGYAIADVMGDALLQPAPGWAAGKRSLYG